MNSFANKALGELRDRSTSGWSVTATADNAAATATRAAQGAGTRNYITSLSMSFSTSQTAAKLATLTDGGSTIGNYHLFSTRDVTFEKPIRCGDNAAAVLSLPASGTAGQIGAVTMTGFTI